VTTYFWKNLECELCKQAYPYETKTRDGKRLLNIIDYELPQASYNYVVLESISSNTSKVIHVLDMQHESNSSRVFMGRGHDSHVRITDISVSRLHAFIVRGSDGFYYLFDNDSKFGTLALIRRPLELTPDTQVQVQVSRSILNLDMP
jgi:hypothetical protein